MEYTKIAGIDKPISRIVFGTDRLKSRRLSWLPERRSELRAFSLLDRSIELGCNTFDTARIYGDSERTLGAWMRKRRQPRRCRRHQQGVSSRRLRTSAALRGGRVTRSSRSLAALGTDFIDLYLLHFDHPAARIEPILEQLNRHIDDGKIAAIGASNWSHDRIDEANALAAGHGLQLFSASSVQFSLADWTRPPWPGAVTLGGDGQHNAREWYSTHDLPVFAWSSLARGFFANPANDWAATYFGTAENNRRLERARILADEHHVTVAQVALAYVLSHPLRVFAVVGCATQEKLADDVGAMSLKLDEAALRWLATGEARR